MKVTGITDVHGDVKNIDRVFDHCGEVDCTLISGDLTHFGHAEQARAVIDQVRSRCPQVFAVSGNCDHPDVEVYLVEEGISVHQSYHLLPDFALAGMGKALPGPVPTPNEADDAEFAQGLERAVHLLATDLPLLLLIHQPPFHTLNDRILFGKHVGSQSIRRFIEMRQPELVFCGHIHEGRGIDTIGSSRIINPGPLAKGHYSYAEPDESGWKVEIRTL